MRHGRASNSPNRYRAKSAPEPANIIRPRTTRTGKLRTNTPMRGTARPRAQSDGAQSDGVKLCILHSVWSRSDGVMCEFLTAWPND